MQARALLCRLKHEAHEYEDAIDPFLRRTPCAISPPFNVHINLLFPVFHVSQGEGVLIPLPQFACRIINSTRARQRHTILTSISDVRQPY